MDTVKRAVMEMKEEIKISLSTDDWTMADLKAITYGIQFLTVNAPGIRERASFTLERLLKSFELMVDRYALAYEDERKFYAEVEATANKINTRLVDAFKNL